MLQVRHKYTFLLIIFFIFFIISCEKKEYTTINFATNNTFFTITLEKKDSVYADEVLKEVEKNANIGFGIAIDKAASFLKNKGVNNFIINFSGNAISFGKKDKKSFIIGIPNPLNNNNVINMINLKNVALSTYPQNNIIPSEDSLYASISVIAETGEKAEILSESYFAMPIDDLYTLCRENNTPVLVVKKDESVEKLCDWEKLEFK